MLNNALLRSTKELLEAEEELIREQMEKKELAKQKGAFDSEGYSYKY